MTNTERKKPGEEERKIQVLTVLRNGAILKNIFVTIEKASPTSSEPSIEKEENIQETEEILTCGRHPDCNIWAFRVFDVHGTWIPRKKIPGLRVESSMKMIVEAVSSLNDDFS
ncbi:hypothetical protein SADUNF_Sadunf17G0074600 [Salix dunnii]|uniref:Uncharacterized protein n=1 Tax=Salix dunnii TaxID=1413687 RepID=A0A835J5Y4_9ROSI|nr:hypothetical protein SADUNF_Sadunf17G0074600 [Salix dunnii]